MGLQNHAGFQELLGDVSALPAEDKSILAIVANITCVGWHLLKACG